MSVPNHTFHCIFFTTAHTQAWQRSRDGTELNFVVAELLGKQFDSSSSLACVEGARTCDPVVGGSLAPCPCSVAAEAGGIFNTRNTIDIPNFDGTDANSESWWVKFEAYADLAGLGAHLDVAAEQTAFYRA